MTHVTTPSSHKETNNLDPATAGFLDQFAQIFASIEELTLPEQRATIKKMFHIPEDQLEPIAKVENKVITGRHGPLNIRLFSPKTTAPLPVIIYLHRGGWVYGSIEESESICRKLANETGSIIIAVEYHLSPESKFPVALEDCYDATKWAYENASTFSGNQNKLILCGESAGGNLAAATALMILDKQEFNVAGQMLLYPVLTSDLDKESYEKSPDKALLTFENMQFFIDCYLNSPKEGENPYVSPLKRPNLRHLPPCFLLTAEYDALKHEGTLYEEALVKAGVPVQAKCYRGVIHGFLDLPLNEPVKEEAMKDLKGWLKNLKEMENK
ncbi:MAG: alpha/beta hydrolase [Parachlamydiaceae bacterium]|nr:alpha/beta hydrolase [Parachlamydiaceae bacterium]